MAITNTRLSTANSTPVFTAVGQQAITVMYICNTSGGDARVTVFCIDSSDSSGPSNENTIYSELEVTANDTYVISTEKLILDNGDFIEVEANIADAVTVTVSSIAV
jgi:hypothetical protein